tara:strand:+ start:78 stop:437 length:360 start_codon:yes stop_codon:yes gene_type:complete
MQSVTGAKVFQFLMNQKSKMRHRGKCVPVEKAWSLTIPTLVTGAQPVTTRRRPSAEVVLEMTQAFDTGWAVMKAIPGNCPVCGENMAGRYRKDEHRDFDDPSKRKNMKCCYDMRDDRGD